MFHFAAHTNPKTIQNTDDIVENSSFPNTTLDAINDASMIDFGFQNGHKIVPKTLPNRFEGALKEALVEDNTWKVKNHHFITKKSTNWRYGGGPGLPPCEDLFRINY